MDFEGYFELISVIEALHTFLFIFLSFWNPHIWTFTYVILENIILSVELTAFFYFLHSIICTIFHLNLTSSW